MKIYMAGPLFTIGERTFNVEMKKKLESYGHEVWLPQEHEPRESTAKAIFNMDVEGIDWSEVTVACVDQADPDSGTCWECGYTYAKGKPIVIYRTDFRNIEDFTGTMVNLMLTESANYQVHGYFGIELEQTAAGIEVALKELVGK